MSTNISADIISEIVNSIDEILKKAGNSLDVIDHLLDTDYSKGRSKRLITALVYSACKPEMFSSGEMKIRKISYGKGFWEPEFYIPGKIVMQLYSSKTKLDSNEIKEKICQYGSQYCCLQFEIDDKTKRLLKLTKVDFKKIENNKPVIKTKTVIWER